MLLSSLLLVPLIGIFIISSVTSYRGASSTLKTMSGLAALLIKKIALITSLLNLVLSLILYTLFDFSSNQFQFNMN